MLPCILDRQTDRWEGMGMGQDGLGLEQDWDRSGTGLGQIWDQDRSGTGLGQTQDKMGLGQIWDRMAWEVM